VPNRRLNDVQINEKIVLIEPQISNNIVINTPIIEQPTIVFEKEEFKTETTIADNATTFVANPNLLDKRITQKRERIAILEIPDDESYNMPRKEKKNGLLARLTKKVNKIGAEPSEELPSINNKPNRVWAFVKESFKNETMTIDSTERQ
jgi:hypothetical protein